MPARAEDATLSGLMMILSIPQGRTVREQGQDGSTLGGMMQSLRYWRSSAIPSLKAS
jgi:hypothetical protein